MDIDINIDVDIDADRNIDIYQYKKKTNVNTTVGANMCRRVWGPGRVRSLIKRLPPTQNTTIMHFSSKWMASIVRAAADTSDGERHLKYSS